MPRKSKRAKQSAEALNLARRKKPSPRVHEGFLESSEWRQLCTNEKRYRKRTTRDEIEPVVKQRTKTLTEKKLNMRKRTTRSSILPSKTILRAKAVGAAEYTIWKEKCLKKDQADDIASLFNIGSERTLRRYISRVNSDMAIEMYEDRPRSGRPTEILCEDLKDSFLQYLASRRYHVTIRSVTSWLKLTRNKGCIDSAIKLLNSVGCRRVRVNVKPKLERKHILNRFIYCWERLNEVLHARSTNESNCAVDIFVDEKWFNKMTMGGYIWLPDNIRIEQAAEFWRHKTHIPKIMYFAAISMPQKQISFDGRLYFEPLITEGKAKRNSVRRKAGSTILQPVSMDRVKFNAVIVKVLEATVQKLPHAKQIRIIADGAGGHSVGKHGQKGLDKALRDARQWISSNSYQGQLMHGRTVSFLLQPSQSPDLNTLDLGAWWSLETDVNELRYDPYWTGRNNRPQDLLADLNSTVLQSWQSWKTSDMLEKLKNTLHQNYWAILASRGRNDYDRRSAPSDPTDLQLQEHLQKARLDPLWLEAVEMRQKYNE